MRTEIVVPSVGESIAEVEIGRWLKSEGDHVEQDEDLVELETDKATVALPAPASGTLVAPLRGVGDRAKIGEVLGYLEEDAAGRAAEREEAEPPNGERRAGRAAPAARAEPSAFGAGEGTPILAGPAARREMSAAGLRAAEIEPTGPRGRIRREDVLRAERRAESGGEPREEGAELSARAPSRPPPPPEMPSAPAAREAPGDGDEEIVPLSRIRRLIAARLVAAQHEAALLTTFNEADMSEVMRLRREHGEAFRERHGVKLGIMSFFVQAVAGALARIPALNAELRGDELVLRRHVDMGIAVAAPTGLVVPVLRRADRMSFADCERAIAEFAERAAENSLRPDDLTGGTFSITNGGVFGSLLSTPIVNPPQSAILGMHAIQERPVARGGEVVVRPMMYLALTYDHRVVDGREAVTFLKDVVSRIESPARMLLGL